MTKLDDPPAVIDNGNQKIYTRVTTGKSQISRYSLSDLPMKTDKTGYSINSLDPSPYRTKSNSITTNTDSIKSNSIQRTNNSTVDKSTRNIKSSTPSRVNLKRNISLNNSKSRITNSQSSENFKTLQVSSENGIAPKATVKRSSSISTPSTTTRPRSQAMGFMKPTTSSTTKSSTPSTRRSFSIRSRN